MDVTFLLPFVFVSSILIVLCLVCIIQNRKIREFEKKVLELQEILSKCDQTA